MKARKPKEGEPKSVASTALKWAGGITALLSLVFALQRVIQMISENRERHRSAEEFYRVGKLQQASLDYPAAWKSFESGLSVAATGNSLAKLTGQLDKEERRMRAAQEDLALAWLQNMSINPDRETYTEKVAPLAAVLTRGATAASGTREADLLAHLGWSNFLRTKDGANLTPEPQYRQALQADSLNPYAHAYWGHWLLWTKGAAALPDARQHFAAALRSNRARPAVRKMQAAALINLREQGQPELLKALADMRSSSDSIDERTSREVLLDYLHVCHPFWNGSSVNRAGFEAMRTAIPIAEHDAILQTLFTDTNAAPARERDACRAVLHEQSGQREEALRIWTELRKSQAADNQWRGYADAAIKRLKTAQSTSRR